MTALKSTGVKVDFSDVRSAFTGKGVCGNPETIHGWVDDRTPGEAESTITPSQQSFHPKYDGAQIYANALNARLRQLGL